LCRAPAHSRCERISRLSSLEGSSVYLPAEGNLL
jgi:hypothetical protein